MIILDGFTLSRVAACISFGHGCTLWTMKSWPVLSNLISKYNINLSSLSWTYNQRMTSKMHSSRSTMDAHTVSRLPFFLYFHFSGPKGKGILIGAIFALPHRSVMTTLHVLYTSVLVLYVISSRKRTRKRNSCINPELLLYLAMGTFPVEIGADGDGVSR